MKKIAVVGMMLVVLVVVGVAYDAITDYRQIRSFTYKIVSSDGELYYGMEISPKGDQYELKTTQTHMVPGDKPIEMDQVMGFFSAAWIYVMINPFYTMLLNQLDLDSPQLMLMGLQIQRGEPQQVGPWTGETFALISQGQKMLTWVLNPSIGLPLKTIFHQEQISMELVDFVQ